MTKFKLKSLICMLLAVAMVMSLPIMGSIFAETTGGGLNGDVCTGSQFDQSVYDAMTYSGDELEHFTWPSSGNVLVITGGSNAKISSFKGTTIPAGLVVDFYTRYKFAGDADYTYKLLAHYDTTDGKAYTITSADQNANTVTTSTSTFFDPYAPRPVPPMPLAQRPEPLEHYSNSYTDVQPGSWYYDAVMMLTEGGLVNGYGNGKFGPDDIITEAQLKTILGRLTSWYSADHVKGEEYDYFADSHYAGPATRGFAARSLKSAVPAVYQEQLQSTPVNTAITCLEEFPDYDNIMKWATENNSSMSANGPRLIAEQIFWAYQVGAFNGVDDAGTFNPYGYLTRAQLCQILYNMGWTTANNEYLSIPSIVDDNFDRNYFIKYYIEY